MTSLKTLKTDVALQFFVLAGSPARQMTEPIALQWEKGFYTVLQIDSNSAMIAINRLSVEHLRSGLLRLEAQIDRPLL